MTTKKTDKPRKPVCMLCGQPSLKSICDGCAQRVQGEQLHKRSKETKGKQ